MTGNAGSPTTDASETASKSTKKKSGAKRSPGQRWSAEEKRYLKLLIKDEKKRARKNGDSKPNWERITKRLNKKFGTKRTWTSVFWYDQRRRRELKQRMAARTETPEVTFETVTEPKDFQIMAKHGDDVIITLPVKNSAANVTTALMMAVGRLNAVPVAQQPEAPPAEEEPEEADDPGEPQDPDEGYEDQVTEEG